MKEQDFTDLLNNLKQTNNTLQKIVEQNETIIDILKRNGKQEDDRLNEIFGAHHDTFLIIKEMDESLKGIAWVMKDGGMSHEVFEGTRRAIFGMNADPAASINDMANDLASAIQEGQEQN